MANDIVMGELPRLPRAPDVDTLAHEIYDLVWNGGSVEGVRRRMDQAAHSLVRSSDTELRQALGQLPGSQREVLMLHLQGLTYVQIAQRLGRSSDEVLRDLTRVYVRLRFSTSD